MCRICGQQSGGGDGVRFFTILFMGVLTAVATYVIGPFLLSILADFVAHARRGAITGGDLLMAMLFLSMLAFLSGFWGAFLYLLVPPRHPLEAGGQPHSETGGVTRVQAPNPSAWKVALVGCIFLPFVFAILTLLFSGSMEPALGAAIACWLLLIAAIAFFPLRILMQRRRGDFDIVIDGPKHEISLPAIHGRKARITVTLAEVEAVAIEEAWEGHGRSARFRSRVYLKTRSGPELAAIFTGETESAHAFHEWLEYKLGLPPTSSPA
jgi:hypothetical protein